MGETSPESVAEICNRFLDHDNRLVRQAAIHLIQAANLKDKTTINALRRIVASDEPLIAKEAASALLELDGHFIEEIRTIVR